MFGDAVIRFRVAAGRERRRLWAFQLRSMLANPVEDRLHVGAGTHPIPGWLNTDLVASRHPPIARLDITRPLPFDNETFRFIFSEHLIEHVSYEASCGFLAECHRVLRLGGVVRVATPDLEQILSVLDGDWYAHDSFRRWSLRAPRRAFVINNFMRSWGHDRGFIHDRGTLIAALETAGFTQLEETRVGESRHPELAGLERHGLDTSPEVNAFECMVLEATRT
jgi:predicted SAM-dependent methyltransferase